MRHVSFDETTAWTVEGFQKVYVLAKGISWPKWGPSNGDQTDQQQLGFCTGHPYKWKILNLGSGNHQKSLDMASCSGKQHCVDLPTSDWTTLPMPMPFCSGWVRGVTVVNCAFCIESKASPTHPMISQHLSISHLGRIKALFLTLDTQPKKNPTKTQTL